MERCVLCGKPVEILSRHGLCDNCIVSKVMEEIAQLRDKKRPIYEKWAEKRGLRIVLARHGQSTLLNWIQ